MGSTNYLKDNKELMKEYDYEKNKNIDLNSLTNRSGKNVYWICKKCGGSWEAPIARRTAGSKCPYCTNRKVLKGYNDLATKFPNLVSEWNFVKNKTLKPNEIVSGSNQKVWWKCPKCGYEWEATISSRTITGNKCRNCAINSVGKKITARKLENYGNLTQTHPELVKEWNYERNHQLQPEQFHFGSTQKVWWKCARGHEYQKIIYERTKENYNCPICANESHSSFPEQAIYYYCKKYFSKFNVVNRYKIEGLEADIFIEKLNIAIEYDGFYFHNNDKTKSTEKKKNTLFKKNDIKLIRIKEKAKKDLYRNDNYDVISIVKDPKFDDINFMVNKLINRIQEITDINFKINIDIQRDKVKIMDSYIFNIKKNSLAEKNPEIAKDWNYEKNGNLTPEMFSYSSIKKVWWKCPKGHEWEDSINNRTHGNGCLICSNRKVMFGVNDLYTRYPNLTKEWDYKKNTGLDPKNIIYGSTKKVWWNCSKGHSYFAKVCDRTKDNYKCPYCNASKLLVGYNDLKTKYPDVSMDWNYEKNELNPKNIRYNDNRKFWWKCHICGYEWVASLYNRIRGIGCPKCGLEKQVESFNANQVLNKGSLQNNNPKLAEEWDYEKNRDLTPNDIIATSNKKVWWKCSKGHEWEASISKRNSGTGCPYCSNRKVLRGFNDLATKYPMLLKEWNYSRNKDINPEETIYGSYKRVWWKCSKCGHEWQTLIATRTIQGCNCPICSRKKN